MSTPLNCEEYQAVAEARWLPLADAPRLLAYGGEREMVQKARDRFAS